MSGNRSIPPTWRFAFFISLTDFSKCSKSHNFKLIGSMHNVYMDGFTVYIHADVELLNERMHEQTKVNLTEKS